MGSDGGLDGLQKRLRVFHASYEAGQKLDDVRRRAVRQSLGAVIDFLMAQPNWCAADSALLVKLGEALADVETGHATCLAFKQVSTSPAHSGQYQASPGTSRSTHGAIDAPRLKPRGGSKKSVSGNPARQLTFRKERKCVVEKRGSVAR
jgi:hypothetical protein